MPPPGTGSYEEMSPRWRGAGPYGFATEPPAVSPPMRITVPHPEDQGDGLQPSPSVTPHPLQITTRRDAPCARPWRVLRFARLSVATFRAQEALGARRPLPVNDCAHTAP